MKRSTEKAVLLTAACAAVYVGAYILFVKPILMHLQLGFFHAMFLLVYFFGVIPILLLFRAARWAWAATGAVAFSTALIMSWMTVRWLIVVLPALRTPDTQFMLVGVQLSRWEFLLLLALFVVVALGYVILGSWILKRRA
jgi:hypothetical protein